MVSGGTAVTESLQLANWPVFKSNSDSWVRHPQQAMGHLVSPSGDKTTTDV